ncbi:MAG: hypothetical protein BKP49_08740 [Treponema sp. CETP13]|nr:MAG: hypothetical protein BKP49_08740 [Treponema sp. CETP13]
MSAEPTNLKTKDFDFSWEIQESNLIMTLSAPTTGWVSVGFEPTKMMKDADILLFSVDKDGIVSAEDDYGTSLFGHKNDVNLGGTNNITILSGSEKNGTTTVSFSIPLSSGDVYDKQLVKGQMIKVLFASSSRDKFTSKHNKKASGNIQL